MREVDAHGDAHLTRLRDGADLRKSVVTTHWGLVCGVCLFATHWPTAERPIRLCCRYFYRAEIHDFVPGFEGMLPLYAAATVGASSTVIDVLLEAYPEAAREIGPEQRGHLPLHRLAASCGSSDALHRLHLACVAPE